MTSIIVESVVTTGKTSLNKTIDSNCYTLFVNGKTRLTEYLQILENVKKQIQQEYQNENIKIDFI